MKATEVRLARLRDLRSRLADVAGADRTRIAEALRRVESEMQVIRSESATATMVPDQALGSWLERAACLQLTNHLGAHLLTRREALRQKADEARRAECAARLAHEQIASVLRRVERALQVEQARREQAQLDDLFAISRVRSRMPTLL